MATFPVPPDVRTSRDFRIIKGLDDNLIRTDRPVKSTVTTLIKQGEWVHLDSTGSVVKAAGEVAATPMQGAQVNWTRYLKGDASLGQADAAGNQAVTLVTGSYKAETKLFAAGVYNVGDLLVVIDDGSGNGVLAPVTPAAATVLQLARSVGTVDLPVSSGILTYNSKGSA